VPGSSEPSEIRDWSAAAIKLLQGVVYSDDAKIWNALLQNVSPLESYFGRLGLALIVDESDGYPGLFTSPIARRACVWFNAFAKKS
jgi:hypothetical protein